MKTYLYSRKKGFTLIELLLVIVLLTLVAGLSVPIYQSFQVKNDLDLTTENTVHFLRRAQTLSQANLNNSVWGVRITNDNLILFSGSSFSGRDVSYDEILEIPAIITASGTLEIVYTKMYGEPGVSLPATITFTSTNGDSRNIIIGNKGMLEY